MADNAQEALDRRASVDAILARRGDALVVTGLGSSTADVGKNDNPLNFTLWGAMGGAAMIGLGLALAQPDRRVVVITGDGEQLMGLGSFSTIGVIQPANLSLVVIDNEIYSETGSQLTHTAYGIDLAGVARATKFAWAETVRTPEELEKAIDALYGISGPVLVDLKTSRQRYPLTTKLRDGVHLKNRFREALLGASAFD